MTMPVLARTRIPRPQKIVLGAIIALFCLAAPACASVVYTFSGVLSGPDFGTVQAFTYVTPAFITNDTVVPTSSLTGCIDCATGVEFNPDVAVSVFPDVPHAMLISFEVQGPQAPEQYFFLPADGLATPGTYSSFVPVEIPLAGIGTLTITQTPEPSTFSTIGLLAGILTASKCAGKGSRRRQF